MQDESARSETELWLQDSNLGILDDLFACAMLARASVEWIETSLKHLASMLQTYVDIIYILEKQKIIALSPFSLVVQVTLLHTN